MSGFQHRRRHGAAAVRACAMPPAGIRRHRGLGALLIAASFVIGAVAVPVPYALGQTRAQPAQTPAQIPPAPIQPQTPSPAPPASATPAPGADAAIAAPTGVGLCQCISDHNERRFECLNGPAVCQSACGSTHYSFVPYANFSCPLTAQQQEPQQPPGALPQQTLPPQSMGPQAIGPRAIPPAQPPRTP